MKTLEKYAKVIEKELFDNDEGSNLYGITDIDETNFKIHLVASSDDVYSLIENSFMDQLHSNYDKVIFTAVGWASPMEDNFIPPSQHPDHRRINISIFLDVINKDIIGSCMKFKDEDNFLYEDDVKGLLADSILNLVGVYK